MRFGILLFCVVALFAACKESDLAPGGTVLTLTADPEQVPLNGTSTLAATAFIDGDPVANGTLIRFAVETESGTITPNVAPTQNGVATAVFRASRFPAEVKVSASSGGARAETTIQVEDTGASRSIELNADPPTLPDEGGTTAITAIVTDHSEVPVPDARIVFSTDVGTLESGGAVLRTDQNGKAVDRLTTEETAEVTAELLEGEPLTETLEIPVGDAEIVCSFIFTPTNPSPGFTVTFQDDSTDPQSRIRSYFWDFGDGNTALGPAVQHAYLFAGRFTVAHSVIDISGNTISCAPEPIIVN